MLIALMVLVGAALVVTSNPRAANKPVVRIGKPATFDSRCAISYRAVRFYRAKYDQHRRTLGYQLAPELEQAMSCKRTRERADYWRKAAKANHRAVVRSFRFLREHPNWVGAVHEVQKAFPGTSSWLLSCSAAESRHGEWVLYGGRPYYPGAEHARTFHGWMVGGFLQYMWPTFKGHYRHGLHSLLERGFKVNLPHPSDVKAWLSPLGQAVAGGWARWSGNDGSHWSASHGRGC